MSAYQRAIKPSETKKDLQLIGGTDSNHWCCLKYDGNTINIYDSLNRSSLSENEQKFIKRRYPFVEKQNIYFKRVTSQKDHVNCGVFACAFATTVALGGDPCKVNYSQDGTTLRCHMLHIIREKKLVNFPEAN